MLSWRLDTKELLLKKKFCKKQKKGRILSYKHDFKQGAIQVQVKFRFAFFWHLPSSKIAIQKMFQSNKSMVHVWIWIKGDLEQGAR